MGWETQGQPLSPAAQGKNHSTAQVTHVSPLAEDPKAIPVPSWHGAHGCEVRAGSLCTGPISYFFALNAQAVLFSTFVQTSPPNPHASLWILQMLHLH